MAPVLRGLPLLLVAAICACASGKDRGTAVAVVRNPDAVRGCDLLGRVVPNVSEEGILSEATLRQRVAEMGGDTLLLLTAGSGEAWKCGGGGGRAYSDNPSDRRRTPTVLSRAPTPRTTPRYGG